MGEDECKELGLNYEVYPNTPIPLQKDEGVQQVYCL